MNTNLSDLFPLSLIPDGWLTEKLGYSVWQIEQGKQGKELSDLNSDFPVFAYAKVDASNITMLWYLSDRGFRVIDLAMTLEAFAQSEVMFGAQKSDATLRFAELTDRDAVGRIAGTAFHYSRFHLDPFIPREMANSIKSEWATNYFSGKRGDGMVVAEQNGRVVGFLQLLWQSDDCLVIDLIGVDHAYQGQGIGRSIISYAACFGSGDSRKPKRMKVGTQTTNIPSIRLYESLGFRQIGAQYVLHYHHRR